MADVIALHGPWSGGVAVATPQSADAPAKPLDLPEEWQAVDDVAAGEAHVDRVIVGPNGVFTIDIDLDRRPAEPGPDGVYRDGQRVTASVKHALLAAHGVRRALSLPSIAYPLLVMPIAAPGHQLDRLGIIPGDALAQYIWSHHGSPLRRSQRMELLWRLQRLAS